MKTIKIIFWIVAVSTAITLFIRIFSSNTFDIVFALAIAVWVSIACVFMAMIGDLKELVEYKDKLTKSYKEIIDSQEELIRTYDSILEKDDVIIEKLNALIHFKNKKQENNEDYHV